ncbi:MAG: hypothetical protein LBS61_02205 [Endomicrobium sp.]|nr:hypothetical protein [Endomicrobium sp.]
MLKGESFWCNDNSGGEHLYFIISDPDSDNNVLVVNITEERNRSDKSCSLDVGDHPSIRKKSVVYYRKALELNESKIATKILNKIYRNDIKLTDVILKKIQDGAKKSIFLSDNLKKYFEYFQNLDKK